MHRRRSGSPVLTVVDSIAAVAHIVDAVLLYERYGCAFCAACRHSPIVLLAVVRMRDTLAVGSVERRTDAIASGPLDISCMHVLVHTLHASTAYFGQSIRTPMHAIR